MAFDHSEQMNELFAALAKAQGVMKSAEKDAFNPFFKSRYATLASTWEAARDALSANGLAVTQPVLMDGELVTVVTVLGHASGQWLSSHVSMKPSKTGPQELGSLVSYLRRYGFAAIVGVAPDDDDDDGNAASQASGLSSEPVQRGAPEFRDTDRTAAVIKNLREAKTRDRVEELGAEMAAMNLTKSEKASVVPVYRQRLKDTTPAEPGSNG